MSDQPHLNFKGVIVALLLALVLGVGVVPFRSCSADGHPWPAEGDGRIAPLTLASHYLGAAPGLLGSTRARFAPTFEITGVLPAGSLGLPGETITWVITVTNISDVPGSDLIITDKLPPDLVVEAAEAAAGDVAVSEQMVVFTLPELAPGDQATFFIDTTVQAGPASGVIRNQAALVANGPDGPISQVALAEVSVPTALPPTGYAPAQDDGVDAAQPPLALMVAVALVLIGLTAAFVYYRGRA